MLKIWKETRTIFIGNQGIWDTVTKFDGQVLHAVHETKILGFLPLPKFTWKPCIHNFDPTKYKMLKLNRHNPEKFLESDEVLIIFKEPTSLNEVHSMLGVSENETMEQAYKAMYEGEQVKRKVIERAHVEAGTDDEQREKTLKQMKDVGRAMREAGGMMVPPPKKGVKK